MNNLEYIILKNKLKDLRKKIKDLNIYTERGISEDREESFAFVIYTLQRYLNNYSILEVIESVTDGSGANTIDILDIDDCEEDALNISIFQCKYKTENNLEKTIGDNDIRLFLDSVQKIIIEGNSSNQNINEYLKHQLETLKESMSSINKISVNLVLSTNGSNISEENHKRLVEFKRKNGIISNIEILTDSSFYIEKQQTKQEPYFLPIVDDICKFNTAINSGIVNIRAFDLAELFNHFDNIILDKNIRKLLSGTINNNILESLKKNPQMFWYKNNGLSIVCKRFEPKEIGGRISLEIESPYIVNGGQTAKTIYNYYLDNKDNEEAMSPLYKAFVMARVYQTTNEQEINEIVQGTNTQNKITLFDLKSSKPNLKLYKEYFSQHNISLLIERNIEEAKMAKSINSDKLLQLYCSIYKEIPHKAKISIGKLTENYYDEVYDTPDIYNELLNSFLIYDFVINENKNHNEEHLRHSAFSLIYLICKIDPSIKETVDNNKLLVSYNKALELINEIVTEQRSNDINYTPHNFFKSEYSTKCINDKLIKKHGDNNA